VIDAYEDPRWYYVSIGHGCLHQCAFCAIKLAKGNIKSRSLDIILREVQAGLKASHRKIVLSGDDIGAWGQDINSDFIQLLKGISSLEGDFQVYIRNLEPFWLLRYFESFVEVVKMGKIRAITVPIQSGNDEVLRAMKRGHKIAPLVEIFKRLTEEIPYLLVLTHFMVGLPGEDAKAFRDTLKVIKLVRFEGIAPDRFYAHPNTPAYTMDEQVPYLVKWWRYIVLFLDIIWSIYFNRGKLKGLR
jgi:tRNA A37 methylthiotransferase MiaB